MPSVIDDPASRLYAGALLGKALSKQAGEVGGEQTSHAFGARAATLQAGVASGKIKPSQLSASDASLLGSALVGKPKPPGLFGAIVKPIGSFFSEAGQALGALKGLPQALGTEFVNVFKPKGVIASGQEPKHPIVEGIQRLPGQVAHDVSSPKQIYEHPFAPFLDVAAVGSMGLGSIAKGAVALQGSRIARAAKAGETAAPPTGFLKRAINLGSPQGRAPGVLSPGFGGEQAMGATDVTPATFPRYYATGRPFMKYAVQKPLDVAVSTLKKVPALGPKLQDVQAGYYERKLAARAHGQEVAGASEALMKNKPLNNAIDVARRMYERSTPAGQLEVEAALIHSKGITTLEELDNYGQQILKGEDVDGIIMDPNMQNAANFKANDLFNRPEFRQLIEKPTNDMKQLTYHLREMNVNQAYEHDISPQVIEDAALGRLRELTGHSNEEIITAMKPSMRPQGTFAKGLYALQQAILGEPTAEVAPSIQELAMHLPYGKMDQRVDLLERAYHSMKQDAENIGGSVIERSRQQGYLAGNNMFEKVSQALHDEMGVPLMEAMAFARGVALGSPEGPILPTYVHGASGEGLKFGVQPDRILTKIGRALPVGRFKPVGPEGIPSFYDWPRPFKPKTVTAQTIGRGPAEHYLQKAGYGAFMKGVERSDMQTVIQNAYHMNKDLVANKLNPAMIQKMNVPNPDTENGMWRGMQEAIEKLGAVRAELYDFVPVDTYRNYFNTKGGMEILTANAMGEGATWAEIEKLAEQSALELVKGESHRAGMGNVQGALLPKSFIKNLNTHARFSEQTTGWARALSSPVALWKTAVLAFSPAWLERTTIGHGIIALIDGTTDPRYWKLSHSYFKEEKAVSPEATRALKPWEKAGDAQLSTPRYQPADLPYGINQGGLQQELSDIQGGPKGIGNLYAPRMISKGVHVQNNFQRRAVFLRKLNVEVKQRMAELGLAFDHPGGFWNAKNLDAVLDPEWQSTVLKFPELAEHAFDQLSKVSYTFSQMTPWERWVVRYMMPFYGWYKFVSKFTASMPLNYPGRAAALAQLGKIGMEEHEGIGPMPDYLSGALWFNHKDLSHAEYVNLYGLNPFGDVANPLGEGGPLQGSITLGRTSPIIQMVLSGFGINPITGESLGVDPNSGIEADKFGNLYDTKTGKPIKVAEHDPLQRMLGSFLRTFPEVRNIELAITGGNPVYPESIPFVNEKPIAVNPMTRRGNTWWSALGQEFGVQPREMDLAKFQANALKSVTEARRKNIKTIQRAKERLAAP